MECVNRPMLRQQPMAHCLCLGFGKERMKEIIHHSLTHPHIASNTHSHSSFHLKRICRNIRRQITATAKIVRNTREPAKCLMDLFSYMHTHHFFFFTFRDSLMQRRKSAKVRVSFFPTCFAFFCLHFRRTANLNEMLVPPLLHGAWGENFSAKVKRAPRAKAPTLVNIDVFASTQHCDLLTSFHFALYVVNVFRYTLAYHGRKRENANFDSNFVQFR